MPDNSPAVDTGSFRVKHSTGSWHNLDNPQDRMEPFGLPWAVHFALGPIGDHPEHLTPASKASISKAIPKRQREFATGRMLAAQALQASGCSDTKVERGDSREPLWPGSRVGSISHSDAWAWAAVSHTETLQGLGIDIELVGRLGAHLHDSVFTATEQQRYEEAQAPAHWADLLFSAKESIYKAVNPITGHYIGFHEVDVSLSANGDRFAVRYIGDNQDNQVMDQGCGYSVIRDAQVLTLFAIPTQC